MLGFGDVAGLVTGIGQIGANLIEGRNNRRAMQNANAANTAKDYEFAKNSLLWQGDQLEQMGINRLALLGSQGSSPSFPMQPVPKTNYAAAGQAGLNSAINTKLTIMQLKMQQEQLKHMQLQNKALSDDINNTNNPVQQAKPVVQGLSNLSNNNGVTNGGISDNGSNPNAVTVAHNNSGVASQWTPMQMFRKQLNGDLDLMVDKQSADSLESDKYAEVKHLVNSLGYLGQGIIGVHDEDYMRAYKTLYELSLEVEAPKGYHYVPKGDLRGLRLVKNKSTKLPYGQGGFTQQVVDHFNKAKSYFGG